MNFNRAWTFILDSNLASQKLYEKLGFVREGVARKAAFKEGCYRDQYLYGLLREDFLKARVMTR